jgi:hypothetical protein
MPFRGFAAVAPGQPLEPFGHEPGPLRSDEVEIAVESCGICHSDLSMIATTHHFLNKVMQGVFQFLDDQLKGLPLAVLASKGQPGITNLPGLSAHMS